MPVLDERTNRMFRRLLFSAIAVLAISVPVRAQSIIAEICNKGDTTLHVVRVIYSSSLLSGGSYQVNGWYGIDAGNCEVVYNFSNGEAGYLGFTFLDSHDKVRTFTAHPTRNSGPFKAMAEKFCVAASPFSYAVKTKEETQQCRVGFEPLDFSLRIDPDAAEGDRSTLEISPHQTAGGTVFGSHSSATARMIFGAEVTLYGAKWSYTNGTALPDSLISPKTGLPPLLPKQQYSPRQAPVRDYYQQIKDVMKSFQTCNTQGFPRSQVSSSMFGMDDYGVVSEGHASTVTMTDGPRIISTGDGAAIANLELDKPNIIEQGPGCVSVSFACKNGPCVKSDDKNELYWAFYVNTREQANIVISALKSIAPFYPDGAGEIHQGQ
jgi:hypothetical protein